MCLCKKNDHGEIVLLSVMTLQVTMHQTGCHVFKMRCPDIAGFANVLRDLLELLLSPSKSS